MIRLLLILLAAIHFLIAQTAQADVGEIFAEVMGRPGRDGVKASYEIRQYETKPIKGGKLGLRQHAGEAAIPLNGLSDKKWKLLFEAQSDEIRTAARFPNGRPLPNSVWQIGAGLSHLRQLDDDRVLGASLMVGSSSNQPFAAFRDFSFQSNLIYKVPAEGEASWIYFLSFANNRSFLNYLPLPGFAYFFRATPNLRLALGLPFFTLFWTPFDRTVFNLSYVPLYSGQAKFSYFIFGPAQIFVQAKYQTKNFFLSDRTDNRERMFYEEALASTGFSMPLERNLMMDASVGYSFDRKYFLGRRTSSRKDGQLVRPGKAAEAALKLTAIF